MLRRRGSSSAASLFCATVLLFVYGDSRCWAHQRLLKPPNGRFLLFVGPPRLLPADLESILSGWRGRHPHEKDDEGEGRSGKVSEETGRKKRVVAGKVMNALCSPFKRAGCILVQNPTAAKLSRWLHLDCMVAAAQSGTKWARQHWQRKLAGTFAILIALRYFCKSLSSSLKISQKISVDMFLDAEDAEYVNRGTVWELESQGILDLLQSEHISPFWHELIEEASDALAVRCRVRRRSSYVLEMANSLQHLTASVLKADGNWTDHHILGGEDNDSANEQLQICIFQALLVLEIRLADAQLRVLRDILLGTALELQGLLTFWKDKQARDKRMNILISWVLGLAKREKGLRGRELVVARHQDRILSLELLLIRTLLRVGKIQQFLLGRPRIPLTGGGIPEMEEKKLWAWVQDGVSLVSLTLAQESSAWLVRRVTTDDSVGAEQFGTGDVAMDPTSSVEYALLPMSRGGAIVPGPSPPSASSPQEWLAHAAQACQQALSSVSLRDLAEHPELSSAESPKETSDEDFSCSSSDDVPSYARVALLLSRDAVLVTSLPKSQKVRLEMAITSSGAMPPKSKLKAYLYRSMPIPLGFSFYKVGLRVFERRQELVDITAAAREGLENFFQEQLAAPAAAIVKSIIFRRRESLLDEAALADAKLSLERLLDDFIRDVHPKMSAEERLRVAQDMDMSEVSREFERIVPATVKNIISGKLARIILIQMQFMKKEMMVAMSTLDDLYNANQVNLQLLAVFPAVLVGLGFYFVLTNIWHSIVSKRVAPTAMVHQAMRSSLREVERLLTCSNGLAMSSTLSAEEFGLLAMHLVHLHRLIEENASRFDRRQRRRLEEDLRDLLRGEMVVSQQLAVVRRLQNSYSFLSSNWHASPFAALGHLSISHHS